MAKLKLGATRQTSEIDSRTCEFGATRIKRDGIPKGNANCPRPMDYLEGRIAPESNNSVECGAVRWTRATIY